MAWPHRCDPPMQCPIRLPMCLHTTQVHPNCHGRIPRRWQPLHQPWTQRNLLAACGARFQSGDQPMTRKNTWFWLALVALATSHTPRLPSRAPTPRHGRSAPYCAACHRQRRTEQQRHSHDCRTRQGSAAAKAAGLQNRCTASNGDAPACQGLHRCRVGTLGQLFFSRAPK